MQELVLVGFFVWEGGETIIVCVYQEIGASYVEFMSKIEFTIILVGQLYIV